MSKVQNFIFRGKRYRFCGKFDKLIFQDKKRQTISKFKLRDETKNYEVWLFFENPDILVSFLFTEGKKILSKSYSNN